MVKSRGESYENGTEREKRRLFNVIGKLLRYIIDMRKSKLIEYKKRIKKFMKLGFNLALIEKSAARTNF